jgi:hypothetical protein
MQITHQQGALQFPRSHPLSNIFENAVINDVGLQLDMQDL